MTTLLDRLRDDERSEWGICKEAADEIERLTAEVLALREDAERYRWLRSTWGFCLAEELFHIDTSRHPSAELDAAIDAALAARKGEA